MKRLTSILTSITQRSILSAACFANKDYDGILDLRDESPFDQEWTASYNKIAAAWSNFHTSEDITALIEKIRKESFLITSQATNQHEIASYVSDDFDLIAKALALDLKDPFVEKLLATYLKDRLPEDD